MEFLRTQRPQILKTITETKKVEDDVLKQLADAIGAFKQQFSAQERAPQAAAPREPAARERANTEPSTAAAPVA